MKKDKLDKIDYLILACIIKSDENIDDTLSMVERFTNMRDYCNHCVHFDIQNPPSET